MIKKIGHIITISLLLSSCKDEDTSKVESLYRSDLNDKIELLRESIEDRLNRHKKYHLSFELNFFVTNQEYILKYFDSVDTNLTKDGKTRQDIFNNYKRQLSDLNNYCDSLRTKHKKYFFTEDAAAMKLKTIDSVAIFKVQNDSLFKLMLSSNLKTQLNTVSYLSGGFGCHLSGFLENGNFHDFFIVESFINNKRTCNITIKNNFLTKGVEIVHYDLILKSFKRTDNKDTTDITNNVTLKKQKDSFKTNDFQVSIGHYLFTVEVKFPNPAGGTIKVGELIFDFKIK